MSLSGDECLYYLAPLLHPHGNSQLVREFGFYPKSPPPSPRAFGGGSTWSLLDFQTMALVITSKCTGAGGQNGTGRHQGGDHQCGLGDR